MEMLSLFSDAFGTMLLNPVLILCVFVGVIIGIIFGSIPGLTATMAIVLFLPVTYSMDAISGISLLVALYIGGISGGLISAILLNIPGTPSSIATCLDGNAMARKGEAAKALGVGIVFSFIGTVIGIFFLILLTPLLAGMAIKFGPYEYCAVTIFSFTLVIALTGQDMIKGLISASLGAIFATVGLSPIDSMERYTLGNYNLTTGFKLLVVLIGLFAITEVLKFAENTSASDYVINDKVKIKGFGFSLKEFVIQLPNAVRSALVGLVIGILPGIGGSVSSMMSYTLAKNMSRKADQFGKGIPDGVVASETANNATIGGAIIPLLSLGIPGDAPTAVLLGGLIIHGVTPGPLIYENSANVVYGILAAMLLAAIVMMITEFFGIRLFVKLLNVPKKYLYPIIIMLCCVGAIGDANRVFDCWGIVLFGVIGYLMIKCDFPLPPMILSFILGPTLELNVRKVSMLAEYESFTISGHPIASVFMLLAVISVVWGIVKSK